MRYPVLLMPWPPRSSELRRIDWAEYLENPRIGLLVDPATGEPFGNVISVRLRVLDFPPTGDMARFKIGEIVEMSLPDYLTAETQRLDLGRMPWAEILEFKVVQKPAALDLQGKKTGLPADFEGVKKFLFQALEAGPISELEIIGQAADRGISPATLRQVKDRLRIASIRDPESEYPRTLWRLRMSQSYKLKKKRAPNLKR